MMMSRLTATPRRVVMQTRGFRKGNPIKFTENHQNHGVSAVVYADNSTAMIKAGKVAGAGILALIPFALALSPSALNTPVDYALGVLIPIHAHVSMNAVLSDYIPKVHQLPFRLSALAGSAAFFLGLMVVNVNGVGITESVKTIWREAPKKESH
ncbi:hypothetical protein SDRG_11967 [Saprolegnia diclina VS20]|uniref:Succinate dehydrogenase [ubiquinone] cytochrome b small subunit n=2 Tax=Saprolegnia TaxID=4769 RepID=A0A067CUV0_SAPPC|nr:hypothetical protein SDRG_11967 [Saprolegnia diclina VS20]XP_012198777.1 hypothetical protein SPRG_04463 [Saprolegnia parasitica CBS 223.65]EQC30391.1 hypothetical protein SDRG_11967 [Saprolegnia diclina VS20]KDO30562.1 hypothetical protein SPRG_04463 [Saprolegnia parasitica CBS 223.65]|eukprot:XP_008616244.1 hypothetical protein SDRG_11967 [Saprolegnia diclina VS20]